MEKPKQKTTPLRKPKPKGTESRSPRSARKKERYPLTALRDPQGSMMKRMPRSRRRTSKAATLEPDNLE
jgi:hypothetical protein